MGTERKKILIIEDDATISSMYQSSLEKDGYTVIIAADGERGWQLASTQLPNLILLDIILPKLDGFSVLDKLQHDPKTKNIPVIMLTNLGQDEDKERGKKLHAADYWVKADFTPTQVSDKIKNYIK
ncbi:response regulator [Candidatus Falkowbacteria bacterium CG10_big_fil_rev_8_21_14_0_10_44_15]|uniref:Response regulator n=1 Tax=Candidatus Falkowbacteria bacterium CG10_big_fil_rev_8_21_14_0_10_44_15 TaxID=1974569 RepID=A0A2H0UZT5_9BACT|nr:MAG: response regulator [Candidatus Falkowbacteria bacterium CG10_big_fil_rev_8_21_14_0_10_44_15]